MVGRKAVSQEAWDDAVASYADLGMEPDEAVQSAVEEFTSQGADISGVIQRAEPGSDVHPASAVTAQLGAALSGADDHSSVLAVLLALQNALGGQKVANSAAAVAGAGKEAVPLVLQSIKQTPGAQLCGLQTLKLLFSSDQNRSVFAAESGAAVVLDEFSSQEAGGDERNQAAAEVVEAAATKCEDCKSAFVGGGVGKAFDCVVRARQTSPETVEAISRAVRKLTTADDDRPVVSRAFQNSRALSHAGLHMAFLAVATQQELPSPDLSAACCSAIRKLAVNDELCSEVAQAGGVALALKVLRENMGSAPCVAAACGLLRQMAASDAIKTEIVQISGLEAVAAALCAQEASPAAMEQALGLVAAVTLRNPDAAAAAMQCGVANGILQVMESLKQQWVQRQACMALRNLVARNTEFRPALLELGAEEALRSAKADFPASCTDVSSAALRDLGFDDYNT